MPKIKQIDSYVFQNNMFNTLVPKKGEHVESIAVMHELQYIKQEIGQLKVRSRQLRRLIAGQKIIKGNWYDKPIKLYAIRCEDNCYYVGTSRAPEKRYRKHGGSKGAMWTRLHKPIEMLEIRDTHSTDEHAVALLEDEMTLEYAYKYGREFVRGGGYVQMKPRWPK